MAVWEKKSENERKREQAVKKANSKNKKTKTTPQSKMEHFGIFVPSALARGETAYEVYKQYMSTEFQAQMACLGQKLGATHDDGG